MNSITIILMCIVGATYIAPSETAVLSDTEWAMFRAALKLFPKKPQYLDQMNACSYSENNAGTRNYEYQYTATREDKKGKTYYTQYGCVMTLSCAGTSGHFWSPAINCAIPGGK